MMKAGIGYPPPILAFLCFTAFFVHAFSIDLRLPVETFPSAFKLWVTDGFMGGYEVSNRKISPKLKTANRYAVIFDPGSTGSRVHVFCFNGDMDLVPIGDELEIFASTEPGLSSYANDPQAGANSLLPLLEQAEAVVSEDLQPKTPVKVGATAGLRQLGADASEKILEAVRALLRENSSFKYEANSVTVLSGSQEGSYMWVAMNYLLGNLGKEYSDTTGIIDLGGGSVQMGYAISEKTAATAPSVADGEDPYVNELFLKGTQYYLYVHSYLNYGLAASRAQILEASGNSSNPCILEGYDGYYTYGGKAYKAKASPSGSNLEKCREVVLKALNVDEACPHKNCTFGGIWNGGGGDGLKSLYVASLFFDKAVEANFVNSTANTASARPVDFKRAAISACRTSFVDAKSKYPEVSADFLPYMCMDLTYEFTLLVDGFGLDPWKKFTLVKQVEYRDYLVEAAWPLGSAIEAVSSST